MLSDFDQDLPQVLARAWEAGVNRLLVPGLDLATSRSAVELAEQHPQVFAAIGVHPHYADTWNNVIETELRMLAHSPKVVAIGEIGLDYYRNLSPPETQRTVFKAQLDLAAELERPVVIHNRQSIDDVMTHLLTWSMDLPQGLVGKAGVLHANSADLETANKAIAAGFYIGVAGPVTYRNAETLRQITIQLPIERQILETDAPFLTPHPNRGQRNEPAYVRLVAERFATLHSISLADATAKTSQNATNLFNWNHENENSYIL
jgi:TatD DNase family protein